MESKPKKQKSEKVSNDDGKGALFHGVESLSATEYLARVSQQAKSMPNVFTESALVEKGDEILPISHHGGSKRKRHHTLVPIDGSAASLAYLLSRRASLTPPPSQRHLPINVDVWTKLVILNFEKLRKYLEDCRNSGVGGRHSNRKPLPPMKERASWHVFCVGLDETNNGIIDNGKTPGKDQRDEGASDVHPTKHHVEHKKSASKPLTSSPWKANLPKDGFIPTTQLLCQMDQVMVRRVISHLTHSVHGGCMVGSNKLAVWLYALLARLEKPIHRDDAAVLFSLLKDLCLTRSKVELDSDVIADAELSKLNTLITLIGVYFEQGGGVSGVLTCT
jgi:survival of motor neuron protein-interacting protein 1